MSTPTEVTPKLLRDWSLPRPGGAKDSRGRVLIIGGSRSTPGAVLLAGVAALRAGAGVLGLATPEPVAIPVAVAVPESGVRTFDEDPGHSWSKDLDEAVANCDAVLLGPGLDDPAVSRALLTGLLRDQTPVPVVLDAFALGVLPQDGQTPPNVGGLVLTPNSSEAARLLERSADDLGEEADTAVAIAHRWQAVVTFKSMIAEPSGKVWRVSSGHPGLGTSGSGDVLSGALVGLLARGAEPVQAAVWATYLHATAGDRLAPRVGGLGFLARELADELPSVLTELTA